jgi:hypothetical protein
MIGEFNFSVMAPFAASLLWGAIAIGALKYTHSSMMISRHD